MSLMVEFALKYCDRTGNFCLRPMFYTVFFSEYEPLILNSRKKTSRLFYTLAIELLSVSRKASRSPSLSRPIYVLLLGTGLLSE